MPTNLELAQKVEEFQNVLISYATGGRWDESEYQSRRDELLSSLPAEGVLPRFVRYCIDLRQFWHFIKGISPTYKVRREYLWAEFGPVINNLNLSAGIVSPSDGTTGQALSRVDLDFVHETWQTALRRRFDDPKGAITASRTLIETVCKCILDNMGIPYKSSTKYPQLYFLTSKALKLAPGEQSEEAIKRTLGGIVTTIEGIGSLRNIFGDAHGRGRTSENPRVAHAELVVNISGALCTFLFSTWQSQQTDSSES